MSITIKDVAKRVGVTPATVSMVINHKPRISDETRRRVFEAIEELDYFPHAGARSLVLQRTNAVGIAAPAFSGHRVLATLAGIEADALGSGNDLVLFSAHGPSEAGDALITRIAREHKVDGLIALNLALSPKQLGYFHSNNVAIVGIESDLEGCDQLLVDHAQGAYLATQHLLGLGHRRIALLNGPASFAPSKQRAQGYRQALVEARLPLEAGLQLSVDTDAREEGYAAAERLLQLRQRPTAIFVAAGDVCAAGVLLGLRKNGLDVPRQMSVVGFDNQPFAELVQPALTTVHQPLAQMGALAFQWLRQAMHSGEGRRRPKKQIFQTELVVRLSTDIAPEG